MGPGDLRDFWFQTAASDEPLNEGRGLLKVYELVPHLKTFWKCYIQIFLSYLHFIGIPQDDWR